MIGTAAVFSAEADVQRRDPEMLQERRVIGAGAQCTNAQVVAFPRLFPVVTLTTDDSFRTSAIQYVDIRLRVDYIARSFIHKFLERVRSPHEKKSSPVRIGIYIHDCLLLQCVGMGFHPFGRAEKS